VPATLAWAVGANLPIAEGGIVAQPESTGLLALAGPSTTAYNLSVIDPSWKAIVSSTVQPLDFARSSPGVGLLPNGYYVVFGGTQNGFATAAVTQFDPNTVTVVDGATNQTRSLRSMNTPRALLGWATDPATDNSYAIGGENNNGTPLATMEVYSPSANTWTYVASLPQTLYAESAVGDGAGHLYTFGGVGADGTITNTVYRYTIATNTWDQVAPMLLGVRDSAAVLASNGLIYVLGGKTSAGTTATVESYDIANNAWTLQTSLPQPVSSEAAAVDSLGRIEVLGGYDALGNGTASVSTSQKLTQPDLAPTITSSAPTAAVVNSPYAYQVLSTANPQPIYSLTAPPAGMTINPNTGLISWTPSYATEGIESVTVVASSSVGSATQTYSIRVAPAIPTGLSGASTSTTSITLSWNASPDPNVTGYNVYLRTFVHYLHGGGTYYYTRVATNVPTNSATISGTSVSGTYLISAVNSAGLESTRSPVVSVQALSVPSLWGTTTTGGAVISSLALNVGQQGQIYLLANGNEAPTFSVVSGPSGVTVNQTTGLVTYTPVAADIGNVVVTFKATNSVGSSTHTFTFVVSALVPTITAASGPFTYDSNAHAASATAVGVDGVTPVAGSFAFSYNGSATPPAAAGTYPLTVTFTSADPNYANKTVTGSVTINPATPTVTVSAGPFTYDGSSHQATATAVGVDGVTPVNGTFTITYNGGSTPPTGPGLSTVTASFASNDPNYVSVTAISNLIINSLGTMTPNLTLVDGSAPYDRNTHADSAVALAADNVTPVAGSFIITYNGSTTTPTRAGAYAVVATFISSDNNYANASITGSMSIAAVAPTLTIDPTPFTYNGASHAALVSALGVDHVTPVAGTFTVTYNGSPTAPVNAGTYQVTVNFVSNDSNYLSTSVTSSINVLPATPSVGLLNGQWMFTYDGTPKPVTGSAVGIDGVTPVSGSFTYTYYPLYGSTGPLPGPPVAAGSYTFNEYFTSSDPNYSDGTFSYDLDVYAAVATVTVSGGPYTYDGTSHAATVTAVGVDGVTPVAGTATVTYNGSSNAPTIAGTYAVQASFSSSDPNYYASPANGTLVITKATPAFGNLASPTVNVGTATVTLSGHIAAGMAAPNGDAVSITLNGVTQSATVGSEGGSFSSSFNIQSLPAGIYPITYEFLGDATRFNAAGTGFATGTLIVRGAPSILVNPLGQTVTVGQTATFTVTSSGYPIPTVQWQVTTNGTTFTNIAGAITTAYSISPSLADTGKQFRAVFTNSYGSAISTAAPLTVVAPVTVASVQVNDGSAQRSEVRSIAVTFSGPVTFAGGNGNAAAAFQLLHVQTGNNVVLSSVVSIDAQGRTVVTLYFSGSETDSVSAQNGGLASLSDGRYSLTISAVSIFDANSAALDGNGDGVAGGNYVSPTDTQGGGAGELRLYRLFGDATGDGVVDQLDLGQFRAASNSSVGNPAYVAYLDADNSGTIDQIDLGQFRVRNNASVFDANVPGVAPPNSGRVPGSRRAPAPGHNTPSGHAPASLAVSGVLMTARKPLSAAVGDPFYLSFLNADNSGAVDQIGLGQSGSRFNYKML
jgi:hypothetical protein